MKVTNKITAVMFSALLLMASSAKAADIVIGVPNWPSVDATGYILKAVLEDNLGLEVEIQNGNNAVVFEAMDKGDMHVHPEVWLPNQQNLHDTYVMDKSSVAMNPNGVPGIQAMCVTKHTADTLGVKSITDLSKPEIANQFDSNGDGKGEIWIGAAGWASTKIEQIRAKSYGYDQTLDLQEMDETLALSNLDAAIQQEKPFVFFCYTPHHMFQLYDLVMLEEPEYDPDKWIIHQPTDNPNWLEDSSAGVAWKVAMLHIHYAKSLEETHPEAASILSKVNLTSDQVAEMVYAKIVEGKSSPDLAREWVDANGDTIDEWLK